MGTFFFKVAWNMIKYRGMLGKNEGKEAGAGKKK